MNRLEKHIAKELIFQGYDDCDINQVIDNYRVRLQHAASDEEKAEIHKEYEDNYNIETTQI